MNSGLYCSLFTPFLAGMIEVTCTLGNKTAARGSTIDGLEQERDLNGNRDRAGLGDYKMKFSRTFISSACELAGVL
jgi:hypothetical protein